MGDCSKVCSSCCPPRGARAASCPGRCCATRAERDSPSSSRSTACPHCGAPFGALVCTECWDRDVRVRGSACPRRVSSRRSSRAVVLHKDAGERRLAPVLGGLLAETVARAGRTGRTRWPSCRRPARPRRAPRLRPRRALAAPVAAALGVPLRRRARAHGRARPARARPRGAGRQRGRQLLCGRAGRRPRPARRRRLHDRRDARRGGGGAARGGRRARCGVAVRRAVRGECRRAGAGRRHLRARIVLASTRVCGCGRFARS